MQIWNEDGQASLFAPDGCAGRTCPARSAQGPPRGRISASSWRRSSELKAIPFMSLDLTPGHGNLLGESYWEMTSPLLGGSSMLNTGPAPLSEEDVYSLSQILQDDPHHKYYLSRTACLGILRRARERGKELPPQLKLALMAQAGLIRFDFGQGMDIQAFHINQRNEGIDLGGVSGALMRTQNMQMQTFVTQQCLTPWDTQQARIFTPESKAPTLASADGGGGRNPGGLLFAAGFCAGAGPSAGGIGYMEECSPTLKASESGTNMVPSVLCLNDQGGGVMACSEDVAGTLRAQEHGHQPLVMGTSEIPVLFENHGKDARYKGPLKVAPTVVTTYGTGGNNLPLVRMFSRQRVDVFKDNNTASTESARQHKDATDLVLQKARTDRPLLIRRLTPLECERLQGFPDHWTDLPVASDSSRYRALGNSVAIPCVEYIMRGITMAVSV